jgi:hypothetical protein
VCVADPVRKERERDRGLDESDVPGPEGKDGDEVHDDEDERGGDDRPLDPERTKRRPDREELRRPPEHLERERAGRGRGLLEDGKALTRHPEEPTNGPDLVQGETRPPAGDEERAEEKAETDPEHDRERGAGPIGDPGFVDDVDHEGGSHNDVEEPVGQDGADDGRPGSRWAPHPPGQDDHPRELADATGKHGVAEEADREGGENAPVAGSRSGDRLIDDDLPGDRTDEDRDEVDEHRGHDPAPLDVAEGVDDDLELRAPGDERDHTGEKEYDERRASRPRPGEAEGRHAATRAGTRSRARAS